MPCDDPAEVPTDFEGLAVGAAAEDLEGTLSAGGTTRKMRLVRCSTAERFELSLPAVMGRGSRCDVWVDGNRMVSREHLRIEDTYGRRLIYDLGSRNGTSLNGQRIPAYRHIEIVDGDVLRLADEEFIVSFG